MVRGEALTNQGQLEKEGLRRLQLGLAALSGYAGQITADVGSSLLAGEAYGKGGQVEEGLSVLAEAIVTVDSLGAPSEGPS
jgi:hypothetical protein